MKSDSRPISPKWSSPSYLSGLISDSSHLCSFHLSFTHRPSQLCSLFPSRLLCSPFRHPCGSFHHSDTQSEGLVCLVQCTFLSKWYSAWCLINPQQICYMNEWINSPFLNQASLPKKKKMFTGAFSLSLDLRPLFTLMRFPPTSFHYSILAPVMGPSRHPSLPPFFVSQWPLSPQYSLLSPSLPKRL